MSSISGNVIGLDLRTARDAFDRAYFLRLMIVYEGRVLRVAKHAGLHVGTCRRRLRALGLVPWIRIEGDEAQ